MTDSWPVRSVLVGLTLSLFATSHLLGALEIEQQITEFKPALAQRENAQGFGQDAIVELRLTSIKEAPSAPLFSATGDVTTTGKKLTDDCKRELAMFKIERGANMNKNIPLAEACQADAKAIGEDSDPRDPGAVLACLRSAATGTWWISSTVPSYLSTVIKQLREKESRVSKACTDEIFKTQVEGAHDYRTDVKLHAACKLDAKQCCPNVEPEEGRVQDCLRDHIGQVGWVCQEQLLRQEMENAGDIRLSHRLLKKCTGDMNSFCLGVEPGNARVEDCLEEHREDAGFSAECKEEFEAMMEARAADFRLDLSLREKCFEVIMNVCGYEKDSMDTVKGFDARVIQCLQDYKDELQQPACKEQVHVLTKQASQDIRFDEPLADACFEDRTRLCDGVQAGPGLFRCLQEQREELSSECRTALFHSEVRMAKDGDLEYPMKQACSYELKLLCPGLPHGSARYKRCLQLHQSHEAMSSVCKQALSSDMPRSG